MDVTRVVYADGSVGYNTNPNLMTNFKTANGQEVPVHGEQVIPVRGKQHLAQLMQDSRYVRAEPQANGDVAIREKTTQELFDEGIITAQEAEARERKRAG